MSLERIRYKDEMQRSLRLDVIPEALPVTLVISRLVAIAFVLIAVKMFPFVKYRHYFDEMVTHKRSAITAKHVLMLIFVEVAYTTFPYNLTAAALARIIIKRYNELIDGTKKALESLEKILERPIPGAAELEKNKMKYSAIIALVALGLRAFVNFFGLFIGFGLIERKTKKGCKEASKALYNGISVAIDRGINVIIRREISSLAKGDHPTLRHPVGTIAASIVFNRIFSIPSAVRTHKIIRRINATIRVCRSTADSLAVALVGKIIRTFWAPS